MAKARSSQVITEVKATGKLVDQAKSVVSGKTKAQKLKR